MTGEKGSGMGADQGRKRPDPAISGTRFAGAGFQFAAVVILSAFAGIWIDRKLGTTPWLLIVTVFAGAALGFYSLYRNLMKGQRLGEQRQSAERRDKAE
ncbi:MAG TPA: AtpZ/AtpI family protein [Gemmatimonadaceae bacterium]|nr:AtpZ/AtpI family protein [Gemmatimonadaceae bacterium]